MSDKRIFIIQPDPHPARVNAIQAVRNAEIGQYVTISDETRSQAQNKLLWPLLDLWERNQTLVVNGKEGPAPKETWKVILIAGFRKETAQRPTFAIGLDGELVPLGYSSSAMGKREFADFLTYTLAASGARGMELKEREEIDAYISKYRKPKHQ